MSPSSPPTVLVPVPSCGLLPLLDARLLDQPQAPAFRYGQQQLSLAQLLQTARALAARLLSQYSLRPGDTVAVMVPRSLELPVALLSTLSAGGQYLPLDPAFPAARLRQMLEQSGARLIIGPAEAAAALDSGLPVLDSAGLLQIATDWVCRLPPSAPEDRFCLLYTSGSTGTPKGVVLTHGNVLNCLSWMQAQYRLGPGDVMLHKTPLGFDVSMYELFWPLLAGASVVIAEPEAHKDPARLAELIQTQGVTAAHFVPSMLNAFVQQPEAAGCTCLRQLFAAGEALPQALVERVYAVLPAVKLHNLYGPTEAGVVSHWTAQPGASETMVPIGLPVANTRLLLLDAHGAELPAGADGELWIAGAQLSPGYLGREDLTAERFLNHPLHGRLYRSGDLAHIGPHGEFHYLGRADQQIKLRGIRVEPGEIEAVLLAQPGVREAAVGLSEVGGGDARLVAWVAAPDARAAELLQALAARLPEALVPQFVVVLDELPHLNSGKIDRRALPAPHNARPALASSYRAPASALERKLVSIWESVLGYPGVGVDDRFMELGGNSLLALQVAARLRAALGRRVPMALLFAQPTAATLAAALQREFPEACSAWTGDWTGAATPPPAAAQPEAPAAATGTAVSTMAGEPLAIVGFACRVPGADDVEQFWTLVTQGREGIATLTDAELDAAGVDAATRADPAYVRRAGRVRDPYAFDSAFFGLTPREAELTDPQQRVLLECAWHALEHAGIAPGRGARVGVYVGLAHNYYFDRNLASHDELREGDAGFQTVIASDKDYAATRIAYKLDLRGPALTLQTACSSSGVALHLAAQALRAGDCDAALVGGVRLNVPDGAGYQYVDGGPQAPDGVVRPFDAQAGGMVLSSGLAMLVLKPQSRAEADGDRIYALLRGSAVNNDGADRPAYTAPSQGGQLAVIRAALSAAGVAADTVGYIETHGTGTLLGDPIEVAALASAYAQADRIALGSVKANIGHLDAGSGAIGVIKAALALHHRQLPPSIHCDTPNPECAFDETPLFVNTALADWPSVGPRRAAVSSFGFGGTNFHGILEEAPEQTSSAPNRPWQWLPLSARDEEALQLQAQRLGGWLSAHPDAALADVAYTLDTGRARLARRGFAVARDARDAARRLLAGGIVSGAPLAAPPSVVFLFPGQGAQHVDMGYALYQAEPVFRACIDECAEILQRVLGVHLLSVLYPDDAGRERAAETLRSTQLAQPAIFAVSLATARLWESWGVHPAAMVGHSLGEFVAATMAGVFAVEHALTIIAERARLMQAMPPGGMLAVQLTEDQVHPYLRGGVALAGINSPKLIVLSGPHEDLAATDAALQADGIATSTLHTSHAFHSAMMDPAVQPFAEIVARYPLNAPTRPFVSTLTGGWVDPDTMRQPLYWARQLREPVRYGPAIQTLLATPGRVLLEVGPGHNLSTSARQAMRPEHQAVAVASLPHAAAQGADALEHLLGAVGRLYLAGVNVDGAAMRAGETRLKLGLPGYPFTRSQHLLRPALRGLAQPQVALPAAAATVAEAVAPVDAHPVRAALLRLLERMTGIAFAEAQFRQSFLELGLDSLMLTQIASRVKAEFKVDLRFRQLMEEYTSIAELEAWLVHTGGVHGSVGGSTGTPAAVSPTAAANLDTAEPAANDSGTPRSFGAGVRISKQRGDQLNSVQEQALSGLVERYLARTGKSRAFAQTHRHHLADPRTVSGFRPAIKELVYPIVVERSAGAHLWDLDGNRYVDATCGFGSVFFGHRPQFVVDAMNAQLEQGWEIGPQHPLAGECAALFTQATGLERVAFCNTGSEAVLAAVRLARTVTGRNIVVSFTGDYHGIQDEVLVRAGAGLRSVPAAPGIPMESVANTLILDYGEPGSLDIIRERAEDIAAILIEPVQSRRADFQPREFLQALRTFTREAGIAFIMDEVITGFRSGLQGAQAFYGVDADLATYGKVFGGGIPVGAIAGKAQFMDALDGGQWQYGDDSVPEVGVTYFAGTFVRHPLTLASVRACLQQLLAHPQWAQQVADRTRQMVDVITDDLHHAGLPMHVSRYFSLWKPAWDVDQTHGDLFFYFLRERGIHIWEGRPCFLTTAHSDADCEQIIDAFRYAIRSMQDGQLVDRASIRRISPYQPPRAGARVGRDRDGNPAWFIPDPNPDPNGEGRWLQLERRA